jgi:hypothetical protein
MLMVFLLTRRLFDDYTGVVACATYGILSLGPGVQGTSAHATHFVLLPALGGIALLLKALENSKPLVFFLSGFLLGLSFLMKQPGLFFGTFALLYLISLQIYRIGTPARPLFSQCFIFTFGLSMPYLMTCSALYALGVFEKFWFWTVLYAIEYSSLQSLADGISLFLAKMSIIADGFYLLWIMAGIGLFILWWEKRVRASAIFVCGFFFFSCLAICPGFYFRQHYFILVLPAIAIFTGVAIRYCHARCASLKIAWFIPPLLYLTCFFHGIFLKKVFFFTGSPVTACRYMYYPNPFPESLSVAEYVRNHSAPDSTIAVMGSEPQIYFYARRRSATSYLYMYSLMEKQRYALIMQQEMIQEIERSRPEYIIYAKIPFSWLRREESETLLLTWFEQYRKLYTITGIVEIVSPRETKYLWDDQAKNYRPQADAIYVLKRNAA